LILLAILGYIDGLQSIFIVYMPF